MLRYYFRTTNTEGHLTNEFITITAPDLPEARSMATSYCKEHGIKYRMTPIMEEPIEEVIAASDELLENPIPGASTAEIIGGMMGLVIRTFLPIIMAVVAMKINGLL